MKLLDSAGKCIKGIRMTTVSRPVVLFLASLAWYAIVPRGAAAQTIEQVIEELKKKDTELSQKIEALDKKAGANKFPFSVTGFLKLDMAVHSARLNSSDAPRFAVLENAGQDHDASFNATVEHSRFIFKWDGPTWKEKEVKVDGLFEFDLFNLGDTGDSKYTMAQPRIRLLYFDVAKKDWGVLLRAGQDWDLFSPLNVNTLNTNGNYWFGGNIGFRRPQLQGRKSFDWGPTHKMTVSASANANVGVTRTASGRTINTGEDAGTPVVEGQISYAVPHFIKDESVKVILSGVYGTEEIDGVENTIQQQGIALSMQIPLVKADKEVKLSFMGEVHYGENLDAFFGGGGFNTTTGQEVESASGWFGVNVKPIKDLAFNFYFGHEDLSESALAASAAGTRTRNTLVGINALWNMAPSIVLGLEYTHFRTSFLAAGIENVNMFWGSLIFNY